ncbi:MAG: hypothetical protein IJ460_00510 [Clostridia bacterium]|nr:hypothetical protein [Clostridia bacterium]
MKASTVMSCIVPAAAICSAASLLLPDKAAVKWTNILCAVYILTCLFASVRSFLPDFKSEAEEIIFSSEKISKDIQEEIESIIKDNYKQDVSP